MMDGLGEWVRNTPKEKWPQFLFMSGDQIYADEIGQEHRQTLVSARFAARIPGPVDARPLRDKLVDGAWAGRFAHRFQAYKEPDPNPPARSPKRSRNSTSSTSSTRTSGTSTRSIRPRRAGRRSPTATRR